MPASLVKSFAKKTGKSVADVEKLWDMAKEQAAKQDRADDYAYITGILKKALKMKESVDSLIDQVVEGTDPQSLIG